MSTEGGDPKAKGIALADLRKSVQQTIERLGTQPDLLLIHNPFVYPRGQLAEFWAILEEMKQSGELTASLGVRRVVPYR